MAELARAALRILIADDHELIRRGVRNLLAAYPHWEVVAEASNGAEAVEKTARLKPDVAVLDFSMPGLTGPQAAAQIAKVSPVTRVVVLTMHDSDDVIREALKAGAKGLVLKSDADRDLLAAIEAVAEDRPFFAGRVAKVILGSYLSGSHDAAAKVTAPSPRLTEREREVMRLLAEGMTSKEAAAKLQISVRTVESHRVNMNRKLTLTSVAEMVRYAIRNGIVTHA